MTYGPMYAYVAYIGNVLFPDELVFTFPIMQLIWSDGCTKGGASS